MGYVTREEGESLTAEGVRRQMLARQRVQLVSSTISALVVGVLIGFFAFRATAPPAAQLLTPPPAWGVECAPSVEGTPRPTVTPRPLQVYVSGAVENPRIVSVPPGSVISDALTAVGALDPDADLDALNLAAPLADHQHVLVPFKAAARPSSNAGEGGSPSAAPPATSGSLNINTATAAEFEALPRIGPAIAQRIVDYREAHGPFQRKEDIQQVAGIGPGTYAQIEPYITVGP